MKKPESYVVHLFVPVKIKMEIKGVNSVLEALKEAENSVNPEELFPYKEYSIDSKQNNIFNNVSSKVISTEWAEDNAIHALMDPIDSTGEVMFDKTAWLNMDGSPLRSSYVSSEDAVSRLLKTLKETIQWYEETSDNNKQIPIERALKVIKEVTGFSGDWKDALSSISNKEKARAKPFCSLSMG